MNTAKKNFTLKKDEQSLCLRKINKKKPVDLIRES